MAGSTDMRQMSSGPGPYGTPEERELARKRLERKRKLAGNFVLYAAVNAFLVVIWAVTGGGGFWPGWVLGGWGLLLLLDVWSTYFRKPLTETDIDRELGKRG